jgi:Na+-driven multidrug efflux pump
MAGFAAAGRLDSFAMMPAMNLGQAITTFTGQNIGAGKIERVRKGHLSAMTMNFVISLLGSLLMVFFGRALMGIFTTDPGVIEAGASYLLIVGLFYVLFGVMFINNGVIRGAGDAFVPMVNSLLALYVIRIPCAIIFSGPLGMGPQGIWWSIPAGWSVGCIFSTWYYLSGRWKKKSLVRHPHPVTSEE